MSTVAVTRLVRAPIDRVWSVLTDLPARADWLSTVYSVEPLTTGDFGPGTVWRESRTMPDGDRVTEEFRVQECAPMERFVLSSPGTGADYRVTYTLAPIQAATFAPIHTAFAASHANRFAPGTSIGTAARFEPATQVAVVLEGTASGTVSRLLALVLGGFAASVVEGALRRDLADLAAAAAVAGMAGSAAA
jgi:uncharacterized protein YndB with AHSA1/START domain